MKTILTMLLLVGAAHADDYLFAENGWLAIQNAIPRLSD